MNLDRKRVSEVPNLVFDRPKVGVGVIIRNKNKILLMKRKSEHGKGTWSTPGGYLEHGESPEECAKREGMEEVGVEVSDIRFLAITNDIFTSNGKHHVTIWMEGNYSGGQAKVEDVNEVEETRWCDIRTLPSPLFVPFENLVNNRCYATSSEKLEFIVKPEKRD